MAVAGAVIQLMTPAAVTVLSCARDHAAGSRAPTKGYDVHVQYIPLASRLGQVDRLLSCAGDAH